MSEQAPAQEDPQSSHEARPKVTLVVARLEDLDADGIDDFVKALFSDEVGG